MKIISDVLPEMNFDVNSDTVISAATAFLPQPVEICRTLNQNSEAVEICRSIIMEDVLGDLLEVNRRGGLGGDLILALVVEAGVDGANQVPAQGNQALKWNGRLRRDIMSRWIVIAFCSL